MIKTKQKHSTIFSTSEILRKSAHPSTNTSDCFYHFPSTVRIRLFFPFPVTLHQGHGTGQAGVELAMWGTAIGYKPQGVGVSAFPR